MTTFYKIPLNADLSQTSYRASIIKNDINYIEFNEGYVDDSWIKLTEDDLVLIFNYNPFEEQSIPEPHQPSNTEIAHMISDLQADLIIAGVI